MYTGNINAIIITGNCIEFEELVIVMIPCSLWRDKNYDNSSISLPLSYQKNGADFFRNGMVLLVCYPPISFVLIRDAWQI